MRNSVLFLLCLAMSLNPGATMAGDTVPVSFKGSTTETFSMPDLGSLAVAWHPNGQFIAISGSSETRVYAAPHPGSATDQLKEVVRFSHGDQCSQVVFSQSGNVTTVDASGNARLWRTGRAFEYFAENGHSRGVVKLRKPIDLTHSAVNRSFSLNESFQFSAVGGDAGGVHLTCWTSPPWHYATIDAREVKCLRFIRGQVNGRSNLLAIASGNSVKLWQGAPEPQRLSSRLVNPNQLPERRRLDNDDLVGALTHIRYVERDGRRVRELVAPGTMEFSRDGNTLAVAFGDVVKLWNPFTGTMAVTASHGSEVRCIDWSADGSSLVTVTTDGKIRQWDSRGNDLPGLNIQGNAYYARFSPDGERLLVGFTDAFCLLSVTGDDP